MKNLYSLCLTLCCLCSSAWAADSTVPKVVVSIKPLHSLVAGVMQGVGEPQLLVKKGSPHGYVLRPSEARALANAQLVVWVGHELESFLEKPLSTLGHKAQQLNLSEQLDKYLLPKRQGGIWEKPKHQHHSEENLAGHNSQLQKNADLHLWLDPVLAQQIVRLTGKALAEIDPAHRSLYQANTAVMIEKLDRLNLTLKKKLGSVKDIPYIVFHAAYQYFETAYSLNAVGSITIDPERRLGAKRMVEIRQKIKQLNARCVFSEPQFESRLVATVIEGTGAKTGILDPLGADLPAGSEVYFQIMTRLADNLYKGLK
ncbi:MAG: zinc ABC transporter substrate-binding protein [Thermodesulfobacteriota bacterium]|nr:zinc ABC transporter substrate-binding protein [Thermodesulfobacteriota bacterium]